MSTTRMRLAAIVSAGVLTLGLTACGGDEESAGESTATETAADSATEEAVDEAAADTADQTAEGSAQTQAALDGEEIPVEDFLAMVQEPDEETLSSYTMAMALDLEGQAVEAEGAVDLSGEQPAMQITMSLPQMGEIEMITVDGAVYLAMPGATPEGMYIEDTSDALGQTSALEEFDVSSQWDAWEQGAQKVVFVGDEDVDGTELGHYQITVDPAAASEAVGEDEAAVTEAIGSEPLLYDVWLDDDNLMRRFTFEAAGTNADMSLDNWGDAPAIEAPPADKIMDMGDMTDSGTMPTEGTDG